MSQIDTLALAPPRTWRLDPVHSHVAFEVDYLGGAFKGQFREVDARLALGDGGAQLEGAATVTSIDVKDENLATHLQSPDFFDAERHPKLSFAASELDVDGELVEGRGEITIKGVTRPVVVSGKVTSPMTDPYGNERLGLKLSASVDRTQFGVSWNNPLPSGEPALANDVRIHADLYFVKAA